ncbi:hypothetical protein ACFQ0B_43255 [Nonomuraea thailandensis]
MIMVPAGSSTVRYGPPTACSAAETTGSWCTYSVSWPVQPGSAAVAAALTISCSPNAPPCTTIVLSHVADRLTRVTTVASGSIALTSAATWSGTPGRRRPASK